MPNTHTRNSVVLIDGKVLPRLAATFSHNGRSISICGETVDDIRQVWEALGLVPLDERRVQKIIIAAPENVRLPLEKDPG